VCPPVTSPVAGEPLPGPLRPRARRRRIRQL